MTETMIETTIPETWKRPKIKLIGRDGNAFAILGNCQNAAMKKKNSSQDISIFRKEAMSGDYNNLLCVCMAWFDVS